MNNVPLVLKVNNGPLTMDNNDLVNNVNMMLYQHY